MKKILIVEDDKNIAMALAIRLRSAGYEPSIAYDAVGAIPMASRVKPELVLMDISMPGGGGMLAARRLRSLTPLATIPIIFMTASKQPELVEQAKALGAAAFFEKPYEAEELLASIASVLGEAPEEATASNNVVNFRARSA